MGGMTAGWKLKEWIGELASPSSQCYVPLHKLGQTVFHPTGVCSAATPAAIKWALHLLDQPSVSCKIGIAEMLLDFVSVDVEKHLEVGGIVTEANGSEGRRSIGIFFDLVVPHLLPPLEASRSPQAHRAAEDSFAELVWRLADADRHESLRLRIIALLAAYPDRWAVSMPPLARLVHDVAQPMPVRAAALAALTFVTPVRCPGVDQGLSHADLDRGTDSYWPEPTRQLVALLHSFLPQPAGELLSLRELAMRHLVGGLSPRSEASADAEEGELARLPEELRCEALLRSESRFKVIAAQGICRLFCRAAGSHTDAVLNGECGREQRWLLVVREVVRQCLDEVTQRAAAGQTEVMSLFRLLC